MGGLGRVRVHVIVLTRNRTRLLERSVAAAVGNLQACDVVTVLDDSGPAAMRRNAELLERMARGSAPVLTHMAPAEIYRELRKVTQVGEPQLWTYRAGRRDIAPLRNAALLLTAATGARTNVFVDDDMTDFNIEETHHHVEALRGEWTNVIVGAQIFGLSEMDTITKLAMAARRMRSREGYRARVEELLADECGDQSGPVECDWVSAGYMAFNLEPSQYFAFPPGYNEDWLWCLLHRGAGKVRIIRSAQRVRHGPAETRSPTGNEDLWFELMGTWCLTAYGCCGPTGSGFRGSRSTLWRRSGRRSNCCRVHGFESCWRRWGGLGSTEGWSGFSRSGGLGVVRALVEDGYCERTERSVLGDWCADARAKDTALN